MKETLTKSRLRRLIVAIFFTTLSYAGWGTSFYGLFNPSPIRNPSFDLIILLWNAAWFAYFLILFFWIKSGYAPKPLMVIGTILGILSIIPLLRLPLGLIFALPGIVLMIFVFIQSVGTPQAD